MRLDLLATDGVFSAADAATHGLDGHALARLVRAGECIRLTRGWYAVSAAEVFTMERRHVLTAVALGRAHAGRAAVSHHSALLLHDLPTYAVDLGTVHLTTLPGEVDGRRVPNASGRRAGLVIHRPLPGRRPAARGGHADGVRTTLMVPLAWAVVQTGLVHGPEAALVPAEAALHRSLVTPTQLERAVTGLSGHPGIAQARAALAHADGATSRRGSRGRHTF